MKVFLFPVSPHLKSWQYGMGAQKTSEWSSILKKFFNSCLCRDYTFILHLRWCRDILPSLLLCGPGGLSKAESWHAPECTRQSVPQPALFFTKSFLLHHSSPSSSLGGYLYMATRKEGVMPSIWLCTWSIITHLSTAGEPPFHLFTPSSFLCHCLFPPLLQLSLPIFLKLLLI